MTRPGPRLLDQLSRALRARRYSPRTEETYRAWVKAFVRYHGMRHPSELGVEDVNRFLTHLAVGRRLSAATQAQARAAVMFLYREVLGRELQESDTQVVKGRVPKRLPTVLSRKEVARVLRGMSGVQRLVATLLYGTGVRLSEGLAVRIKDLDLDACRLSVKDGKGRHQRVTVIPNALVVPLEDQIARRRALHDQDLAAGAGHAPVPTAYARKSSHAARDFGWQYLFPGARLVRHPETREKGRRHLHPSSVQRAVKKTARSLGLTKNVSCHTFRHSFATHLLEDGYDIRTIQELLGHGSVKTTMIYTHVLNRDRRGIRSPLDTIPL